MIDEIELHLHPKWQRDVYNACDIFFKAGPVHRDPFGPSAGRGTCALRAFPLEFGTARERNRAPEAYGMDANRVLQKADGRTGAQPAGENCKPLFELIDQGVL